MPISVVRTIARQFMPRALAMGLNVTSFEGLMRASYGKLYRHQDFIADWREIEGRARKRDPLRSIPRKYRPTFNTITPSEVKQVAEYNYAFNMIGFDTITGEPVEQHMIVATDELYTMEEAEEKAEKQRYKYFAEIEITKVERVYVSRKGKGQAAPLPLDYQI